MRALGALALLTALTAIPAAASGYGRPAKVGTITSPALPEVSGLTAASVVKGGWWVENDSGNSPDLHLIGPTGRLLASVRIRGAVNVDWEDLAYGPGAHGRREIYIGDIGDNGEMRDHVVIYRVDEPARGARSAPATAFPFRYPDGPHNAEALFVAPTSGEIYVITKTGDTNLEPCALYRLPLPLRPGRTVTAQRVRGAIATLLAPLTLVTGAAFSPDGRRLSIRGYYDALEWSRPAGSSFASIFASKPQPITLTAERQGEAIAYTTDGKAFVTTSEGLPAPLWRYIRH